MVVSLVKPAHMIQILKLYIDYVSGQRLEHIKEYVESNLHLWRNHVRATDSKSGGTAANVSHHICQTLMYRYVTNNTNSV